MIEKCDVTEIKFYEVIGLVGISIKNKIEKAPPPPPAKNQLVSAN